METDRVLSPALRTPLLCPLLSLIAILPLCAQEAASSQPSVASAKPAVIDYPDSTHGLERLAKDILKAQKQGEGTRASALAESMVLPDPAAWYVQAFGPEIAADEGAKYAAGRRTIPIEILKFFFGALQGQFTDVIAARFAESCDDNAGESAFGTLQLRLQPVPLYELRLRKGDQFLRLFALVYVDGGFRFALPPSVHDHFPFVPKAVRTEGSDSETASAEDELKRIRIGGNSQGARIITKVTPEYPGTARSEHLQGTVRLHAILAKDGSISHLVVLSGYCSLAKASVDAVRKWRYTPTLVNGNPVEVDTTIDVFFQLNR